jgi:hypothetical protein
MLPYKASYHKQWHHLAGKTCSYYRTTQNQWKKHEGPWARGRKARGSKRGVAKRGTAKRGTAKQGTAKRGTAKRGAAKRGAAKRAAAKVRSSLTWSAMIVTLKHKTDIIFQNWNWNWNWNFYWPLVKILFPGKIVQQSILVPALPLPLLLSLSPRSSSSAWITIERPKI